MLSEYNSNHFILLNAERRTVLKSLRGGLPSVYPELLAAIAACSCIRTEKESEFWLGADIGWCTEYEANGHKFYNKDGQERECTALMKELGFNSIRLRV